MAKKAYAAGNESQGENKPVNFFKRVKVRLTESAPKHYNGAKEIVCGEVVANKLVENGQGEIIQTDVKIEGKKLPD